MESSAPTSRLASSAAFRSLRVLTDQMRGQFRSSRSRKPASEAIRAVSLEASMNQLGSGAAREQELDPEVEHVRPLARGRDDALLEPAPVGLRVALRLRIAAAVGGRAQEAHQLVPREGEVVLDPARLQARAEHGLLQRAARVA